MHVSQSWAARCLLLLPLLFSLIATARADQVILKNGDIVSGTVVSKSGKVLTLKTEYAGTLKIRWDKISTLSTDQPVTTLLKDDRYVSTNLLPAAQGNVKLGTEIAAAEASEPVPARELDNILYINPTPEESGRGYRYTGRANMAFSNTGGNSDYQQLHMDGEVQKRAKAYRYTLGGEANRADDDKVRSVSNSRLYASYDSFYTPTDFLYVHGGLENDKFKDIRLRSVGGAGYGYQVYESDTTRLSIKGGPDFVSIERYVAPAENFVALGWHIDFNHKTSSFPGEIFHTQDGYRGFNGDGDITLKTRTGVRIPLSGGVTATAQYNLDWESNPAPGRGNSDRQLLIGIGYSYN